MRRHLLTLLQLLVNAAGAGVAFALLLVALLVVLNPEATPGPGEIAAAASVLLLAYGLPVTLALVAGALAIRFFAVRDLRIGWLHLKAAVWFLVASHGAMSGLYAFNLAFAGDLLGGRGKLRLAWAIGLMAGLWIAGAALAAAAQGAEPRVGLRRRRIAIGLLVGAVPVVFLAALVGRARGGERETGLTEVVRRGGPVLVLGIDGASLSEILPLSSEGRLPAFASLLREGPHGPIASVRPCRSATAWSSLSTGMLPSHHGIKDLQLYRLAGFSKELRTVPAGLFFRHWLAPAFLTPRQAALSDLRSRPLWAILDRLRLEASFLGWPLTGAPLPGAASGAAGERAAWIDEWSARIAGAAAAPDDAGTIRRLVERDRENLDAALRIHATSPPALTAVLLPGLGEVGARFPGRERPGASAGEGEEEPNRLVVPRYYEMLDGLLARARASVPPDGYLLVVSAYGTEPVSFLGSLARRAAGLAPARGGHDGAPAGVLMMAGPGVAAGRAVDEMRVVDVVPLVLYLLGAPVGRDMDGRLPKRVFERPFLESNPISFVNSFG